MHVVCVVFGCSSQSCSVDSSKLDALLALELVSIVYSTCALLSLSVFCGEHAEFAASLAIGGSSSLAE